MWEEVITDLAEDGVLTGGLGDEDTLILRGILEGEEVTDKLGEALREVGNG